MSETITLTTQDGQEFKVERDMIGKVSETVNGILEDAIAADGTIPLPNVTSKILKHCLEFAKFQSEHQMFVKTQKAEGTGTEGEVSTTKDVTGMLDDEKKKKLDEFNSTFFSTTNMDQPTLFEVILAANYLDMNLLLNSACGTVASMIRGRTPDEIRATFAIKNDFTPEEEEAVRKENEWVEA